MPTSSQIEVESQHTPQVEAGKLNRGSAAGDTFERSRSSDFVSDTSWWGIRNLKMDSIVHESFVRSLSVEWKNFSSVQPLALSKSATSEVVPASSGLRKSPNQKLETLLCLNLRDMVQL